MSDRIDFLTFASRIAREEGRATMLPVIEKELLHYEILQALEAKGLLETLVFQGGTCLRLCHGADRYSEDLDFAGGSDFDGRSLLEAKTEIEQMLERRYDVEVRVSEPKRSILDARDTGVTVENWRISVITAAARPDVPQQRISIQIASVPAYTRELRSLSVNYADLPASYSNVILISESLEEICADKLLSFVCSGHIRHRDLWDLRWLARRPGFDGAKIPALVRRKILDYREMERFSDMLSNRVSAVSEIINGAEFMAQMRRFLPSSIIDETLAREKFRLQMSAEILGLYEPLMLRQE